MLVKIFGSAVYGVEAITITIEVNVTEGLHTFLVGLPDSAIKESIQRVESAIKSNGYYMPRTKLVINLAPAGIRKTGSAFDLPIALGVLAASGQNISPALLENYVIMGELGLDGSIHSIKGALPIALQASKEHFKGLIVPRQNAAEAAIVKGLPVFAAGHIKEAIDLLGVTDSGVQSEQAGRMKRVMRVKPTMLTDHGDQGEYGNHGDHGDENGGAAYPDFSDVRGQEDIKRALEIAAAGGHNTILVGPPGSGKTMMAKRLPSILPPLSLRESLETTRIHSVAGKLPENSTLIRRRPFRSPHHTISGAALVGGGTNPQPGEISLAHNGVLFLDELPEFNRATLEVMRQPMEDRKITISRAKMSIDFPAAFLLLASMNPCPCGYHNHPAKECTCPPGSVSKYLHKISGPLLDRIDLHVEVLPVSYAELSDKKSGEMSSRIRERVIAAREIQSRRYMSNGPVGQAGDPDNRDIYCNAQMDSRMMKEVCQIDSAGEMVLKDAMNRLNLSARAYSRILKVGRTIADLAGSDGIRPEHLSEAVQYRILDKDSWNW